MTAPAADGGTPDAGVLLIEQPSPGLAGGRYPASPWVIGALGGGSLLLVVAVLGLRAWRRRRPRSG